jgi:GTP-binding protein HflX
MAEILQGELHYQTLCLSSSDAKLRARLYDIGAVLEEQIDEQGRFFLTICLPKHEYQRLKSDGLLPDIQE